MSTLEQIEAAILTLPSDEFQRLRQWFFDVDYQRWDLIKATGHGSRQACGTNKQGFPIRHSSKKKVHFGFITGDIVKAVVDKGKNIGIHIGRMAARAKGYFDITTTKGSVDGVPHKYCKAIHKKDGYGYHNLVTKLSTPKTQMDLL